jgi:hypothetical protein
MESRPWASCPLTQGGYLRVAGRLLGGTHEALGEAIDGMHQTCLMSDHQFWNVNVDLMDLSPRERSRLIGAGQVTDMQLLMLAFQKEAQLATTDGGIRELARGTRFEKSLLVV